jgi:lectin-like protein
MRVLILAASAMAATGCYSPAIENCQFSCTGTSDCPDSMSCVDGFCHSAATDKATCRDSNGCPPVPGDFLCGPPGLDAGLCVTACETAVAWDRAKTACTGSWTFAVLDTSGKLDGVSALTANHWVSLMRAGNVGTEWQWVPTTGNTVKGWDSGEPFGVAACGAVNASRKLANVACASPLPFLCTAPPVLAPVTH